MVVWWNGIITSGLYLCKQVKWNKQWNEHSPQGEEFLCIFSTSSIYLSLPLPAGCGAEWPLCPLASFSVCLLLNLLFFTAKVLFKKVSKTAPQCSCWPHNSHSRRSPGALHPQDYTLVCNRPSGVTAGVCDPFRGPDSSLSRLPAAMRLIVLRSQPVMSTSVLQVMSHAAGCLGESVDH